MKLKDWRKSKGITQRKLSEMLRVHENSIVRYEAEKARCPAIPVLREIMRITENKVTMMDFFKDGE